MVYNSVKELKEACSQMLDIAADRLDMVYCKKELQESLTVLVNEFEEDSVVDDKKITELKADCEAKAIKMEYCLSLQYTQYANRYRERCFVSEVYKEYTEEIRRLRAEHNYKAVSEMAANLRILEDIYNDTKHLLFELDPESKKLLMEIHAGRNV